MLGWDTVEDWLRAGQERKTSADRPRAADPGWPGDPSWPDQPAAAGVHLTVAGARGQDAGSPLLAGLAVLVGVGVALACLLGVLELFTAAQP